MIGVRLCRFVIPLAVNDLVAGAQLRGLSSGNSRIVPTINLRFSPTGLADFGIESKATYILGVLSARFSAGFGVLCIACASFFRPVIRRADLCVV